ncbi:hypothetical protein Syn7803C67_42 [Synechococcus phage ACG-2014b]|uniref:Uncharacterized protein n=1 Tax=Synechococcus phage ACG-2014b TaxID=1493508 RepID=A0A0E3EYW4_9CAUD|nr:hypothetical protein Syn7803C67_42 [Synechococcus phage ACG-2014b]AIX38910.1 hypothetical protein Syn9311C1_42 [Synechococcus phage ACG-2014b]AIX46098.1 hypothetical protein Syn7803C36_43 [Synechococcus phage ACG-2014b]
MVVTNEVTIPLANLSETNVQKVELIDQTGQMNQTMTISPKTKKESLTPNVMMMEDGMEVDNEFEELSFDDSSEVDYDLDYTSQY